MRTILLLFTASLMAIPATAQVTNGSFEDWTGQTPDGWITNNLPPAGNTVTRSGDAHDGSWAARGEVIPHPVTGIDPYPPTLLCMSSPVASAPEALIGWYKFNPASPGDLLIISALAFDASSLLVGLGEIYITDAAIAYTPFTVPIDYLGGGGAPTSLSISFSLAGPADVPAIGTWYLADHLDLGLATGLADAPTTLPGVGQPWPSPAVDLVRIPLQLDAAGPVQARVLDATGRTVAVLHDGRLPAGDHQLEWRPAATLANGTYHLRIINGMRSATRPVMLAR